jgi:hypothetical protein
VFTLNIPITSTNLEAIKVELIRTLPEVKSSHRCEALGRGLGFRTYAALRAATQSADPVIATASGAAFTDYLAEHQFAVQPLPFYRAVTRVAIRAVLAKVPKLTRWGIGVGDPRRKPDGKWETWQELRVRFSTEREALLSDDEIEPFLLSLAFIARVKPTKTIRKGTGSYRLKHIAENYSCTYPEGNKLGPQYVANGVLIAAAVHAGFNIKIYTNDRGVDSLNVNFNMSKPLLDDLDCEIRSNGSRAQDRWRREEIRKNKALYSSYA